MSSFGRGAIIVEIVNIRKYFNIVILGFLVTFIFVLKVSAQSVAENIRPVSQVCVTGQACVGTTAGSGSETELIKADDEVADNEEGGPSTTTRPQASSGIDQGEVSSVSGQEHQVQMLNQGVDGVMVFEPSVLTVQPGDSVTFKAADAGHNAASIAGMIPAGAESWDSGMSQDITVKFNEEGTYVYQCTPHLMMAMVGVIIVGDASANIGEIKEAAAEKKSSFVMEQGRLDGYLEDL
jgi:pseudoazurin